MLVSYPCPKCGHKISFVTGNGNVKPGKPGKKISGGILGANLKKVNKFLGKVMIVVIFVVVLFIVYLMVMK